MPPESGELMHWMAQWDQRGHRVGLGEAEQFAHRGLFGHHEGGEDSAQPLVPGGQDDVPGQRVDRTPGDQADPVEVLVH